MWIVPIERTQVVIDASQLTSANVTIRNRYNQEKLEAYFIVMLVQ